MGIQKSMSIGIILLYIVFWFINYKSDDIMNVTGWYKKIITDLLSFGRF